MTPNTFAVRTRTTHGFRLIIAVVTAAMIGFVVEVTRPVATSAAHAPASPAPTAAMPLALN